MRSFGLFKRPSRAGRMVRLRRGSALIEATLLSPWFFFLGFGVVDMGFYTYSMIAVENATRVAAEYTSRSTASANDQYGACTRVLNELSSLPNLGSVTSCGAAPLVVTASSITGPDGKPATSVSVTYRSNNLIPLPGMLRSRLNITRNVQMRVKP